MHFFALLFAHVAKKSYLCIRFRKGNKSNTNITPKSRKGNKAMKTYKTNLESLLAEKQNVSGIRGNVRKSLKNILAFGYATTGKSDRSGKDIWTRQVADILRKFDIPCKTGNVAQRGGANGEFVVADADEFRTEVAANRFDILRSLGKEYMTIQEKEDRLNARINAFIENPTFIVSFDEDNSYNIRNNEDGEYIARHNFMAYRVACLPAIAALFAKNGIQVTADELEHNYMAWRGDYKSQVVTADKKFAIFTPCGCNDLRFTAYVAKADSETYIA